MSVAITLDIDWVPDGVIDAVAARLIAAGVRATWFVTHASAAVDRLRAHPALFELGIHPNFLAGSTHGTTPTDILHHCMALVPDARVMRTHSLVQSTPLLECVARETPIAVDVSLHVPLHRGLHAITQPLDSRPLQRLPFWWEDDYEMYRRPPEWDLVPRLEQGGDGLRILNFHPIHVFLNSASLQAYGNVKRESPSLTTAPMSLLQAHVNRTSRGTGTAFDAVVEWLARHGGGATISELAAADAVVA